METSCRNIAVFTGTRAEYGLLRPVLSMLRQSDICHLQLLVSGSHLSKHHGYTVQEIIDDGFQADALLPIDLSIDTPVHLCKELGKLITTAGEALHKLTPHILVLLGDRYETLGVALAASMLNIPIAHLHGGEITAGAMDDNFRHCISKLAHLHFTSCEDYRQRVIQLGEQPANVYNVGALGVENARSLSFLPEDEVRSVLNIKAQQPYIVVTYHPVTLEQELVDEQLIALTSALDSFPDYAVIYTGVNADPSSDKVAGHVARHRETEPDRVRCFSSLGVTRYLSAVRYAACVVGNSSSGIIEVPSLRVPVVNVGNRQKGRIHAQSVIDCSTEVVAIREAIAQALSDSARETALNAKNPYEPIISKKTSALIAEILCSTSLSKVTKKEFFDLVRG